MGSRTETNNHPQAGCEEHLALVPLHPGNKKKLESKNFPLVLGRTNLASWWWKSCECNHYCRLHCRPVAQNIRSLSKIMVMIDSKGQINAVGKNPHLITITPERCDNLLKVNDILTIGRRDREPWMRLQVVKRKVDTTKRISTKAAPELMSKQDEKKKNSSSANSRSKRRASSPPEWITTTRKRKTSSRYSNPKQQKVISTKFTEASDNLNQSLASNHETDFHPRKRRRTRENVEKKSSRGGLRERNQRRSLEESNDNTIFKHERQYPAAGAARAANHIHLVFQDYETSAMLVKATQRKRKRKTSNKHADPKSSARRSFVVDKGQLRLLSQNFARAMFSAKSPANSDQLLATKTEAPTKPEGSLQLYQGTSITAVGDKREGRLPGSPEKHLADNRDPREGPDTAVQSEKSKGQEFSSSESVTILPSQSTPKKLDGDLVGCDSMEPSFLSLPQCTSSTFANSFDELQRPTELRLKTCLDPERPLISSDPKRSLGHWKTMVENEKDNPSSFRHALADLILTKNQGNKSVSLLWMPDLLEDV